MLVLDGANVTITIDGSAAQLHSKHYDDYFIVRYSEPQWPTALASAITVTVTGSGAEACGLDGGPYVVRSDHDRTFMTSHGSYVSAAGAWWVAKQTHGNTQVWESLQSFVGADAYETSREIFVNSRTGR
jgi:hypothetical protein